MVTKKKGHKEMYMIGNHTKLDSVKQSDGYPHYGATEKIHYGDDWVKNRNIQDWKQYHHSEPLIEILRFFGARTYGGFSWGRPPLPEEYPEGMPSDEFLGQIRERHLSQALQDTIIRANELIRFIDELTEIITDSKAGRNLLHTDEMWYGDVSDSETLTAILDMMTRDGLPEWCNNVKLYMEEGE